MHIAVEQVSGQRGVHGTGAAAALRAAQGDADASLTVRRVAGVSAPNSQQVVKFVAVQLLQIVGVGVADERVAVVQPDPGREVGVPFSGGDPDRASRTAQVGEGAVAVVVAHDEPGFGAEAEVGPVDLTAQRSAHASVTRSA